MGDCSSTVYPSSLNHSRFSPRNGHPSLPPKGALLERRHIKQNKWCSCCSTDPAHTMDSALAALEDDDSSSQICSSYLVGCPSPRSSLSGRVFAPLTPIIASPLSTPVASTSSNTFYLNSDPEDEPDRRKPARVDYIAKGDSPQSIMTPTWTSTPPTPPPHRSASQIVNLLSTALTPSASSPAMPAVESSFRDRKAKRRASLPPMALSLSKPLPPTPPKPPPARYKSTRVCPVRRASPLRAIVTESQVEPFMLEHRTDVRFAFEPSHSKPRFHIPDDSVSDKESDGQINENGDMDEAALREIISTIPPELIAPALSPKGHHDISGDKDSTRQYHALMELLNTEVGYLLDLKVLVMVYLRLLPVLTNRPLPPSHFCTSTNLAISRVSRPPPSSFILNPLTPISRANSSAHLSGVNQQTVSGLDTQTPAPLPVKDKDKSARRHVFTTADLDSVTRNAEDILSLHENFVRELLGAVHPFRFFTNSSGQANKNEDIELKKVVLPSADELNGAIRVVCKHFIDHASKFDLYQSFCSGHPEAFDLVRKVQREHSVEWEVFEQNCATIAASVRQGTSEQSGIDEPSLNGRQTKESCISNTTAMRMRRHSLSSLEIPSKHHVLQQVKSNYNLKGSTPSASESGHLDTIKQDKNARLLFMDYLIKPVQRICKYPLLLAQLQTNNKARQKNDSRGTAATTAETSSSVDLAVQSALQAMRLVASSVDEARRCQDLSIKSSLIVTRVSNFLSQSVSSTRPGQHLTQEFLSSLGQCHLAGSLDVIHYHSQNLGNNGTVKAKYLGSFLYPGGYLILVKVVKGKIYEPKHWFSLAGFEVVDAEKDKALLPSWFRLSCKGHLFELAASCLREKDIWMTAINQAQSVQSSWADEPVSSLHVDGKYDLVSSTLEDGPFEVISTLPTIQSIPELELSFNHIAFGSKPPSPAARARPKVIKAESLPPPSRRSSTTSVKGYFSNMSESESVHLVRATAPAREQVDRGLIDVFSESCLSARFHAHTHEEELFHAQKMSRTFPRTGSGLGMAGAMSVAAKNRLTKRESVLVPRRKSFVDGYGVPTDMETQVATYNLPANKSQGKRRQPMKLKIVPVSNLSSEGDEERELLSLSQCPTPISQCSSLSARAAPPQNVVSLNAGPLSAPLPSSATVVRPEFLLARQGDLIPKRSRSMVEGVRGLFQSRSSSPTYSLPQPSTAPESGRSSGSFTPILLKWWSKGSLRRRVRSAPDVPVDETPPRTSKSFNTNGTPKHSILPRGSSFYGTPHSNGISPSNAYLSPREPPVPVRKKSIFSPNKSHRTSAAPVVPSPSHEGETPPRSLRHRHLSILHRFSTLSLSSVLQSPGS